MKLPAGRKAILLLGLPLGLAVAGALAYTQLASGEPAPPPAIPEPSAGQHGIMLKLDDRVVNLQATGPLRFVKIAITVEIRPEDAAFYELAGEPRAEAEKEAILDHEPSVPILLDAIGNVVSAKDSKTISTVEGRAELREQLLDRFREILGEHEVLDLYFTELVMQ